MLDNHDWNRLIDGLIVATNNGSLRWAEEPTSSSALSTALAAAVDAAYRQKMLVASSRRTMYQLSSRPDGSPPYELRIVENENGEARTIDRVRSSTSLSLGGSPAVNGALARLYDAASHGIESGDETVARLLGDLGL